MLTAVELVYPVARTVLLAPLRYGMEWTIEGAHLIPPVLGTAVFLYGGRPFLEGAIRELRARLPGARDDG